MPKYEVLFVCETSFHYYVGADDEVEARSVAEARFANGEPDENPSAGWCKTTDTYVKEVP